MNLLISLIILAQVPNFSNHALLWKGKARLFNAYKSLAYQDTLHDFDVLHYDIHVRLNFASSSIEAYNEVQFRSKVDNLSSIFLHLVGFTIDSVIGASSYSRSDSILNLVLPSSLNQGDTGVVTIYYHGRPAQGGGVFGGGLHFEADGHLAYVDDEPFGAKRWVPIYDLPSDKALADQYITVPVGYWVVANGEFVDSTLNQDNTVTFHWRENYPIANYLIVFAAFNNYAEIRDSAVINGETLPVFHWFPVSDTARLRPLFQRTPEMLEFLSQIYGTYPFMGEKYSHVSAPIGGAMENQTNTFINTDAWWGSDWDWVIVHEMGHQWWGDWLTLGTWADIWLNEGFATYTEALWEEHRYGATGLQSYMHGIFNYYLRYEPYPPYPVYDPDYMWGVVVYQKGASVLHMLRWVVGDSAFFHILRAYGEKYAYGNAITTEFMDVVDSISGQNFDWFFNEWIFAPGHPVYQYSYSSTPVSGDTFAINITIDQVQSHAYGVPTYKMPIPFRITTTSGVFDVTLWDSLDHQTFTVLLPGSPTNVAFDPDEWILEEHTLVGVSEGSEMPQVKVLNTVTGDFLLFSIPVKSDNVLRIYNVAGRMIKEIRLQRGVRKLYVGSLKPGVYYALGKGLQFKFLKY